MYSSTVYSGKHMQTTKISFSGRLNKYHNPPDGYYSAITRIRFTFTHLEEYINNVKTTTTKQ